MEKKFIKFLDDNCALGDYESNLMLQKGITFDEFQKGRHPSFWIEFAFDAEKTKEGAEFWKELSKKWRSRVDYNLKKRKEK
jgi:hypothetical protein